VPLSKALKLKIEIRRAPNFASEGFPKRVEGEAIPEFNKVASEFGVSQNNRILKVGKPYEVICNVAEKTGRRDYPKSPL